ncbi:hypothetical protein AS594_39855 [Streptomyces agglomeratus]|uniref:Uncharacterized protein n=1 Tax=Streptomyces agglomeratus TaxID=285458 RepID=A0A1E5NZC8_9ACTN|nr:hypothetical protein [Streptomyces agglomeratus]OEJ21667.1 hypothetical protein AS594_39855 [Streptomyces agglomeratus]
MPDADELLERIRTAKDWATSESGAERTQAEQLGGEDGAAHRSLAVTYLAIALVLDKILQPPQH